MRERGRDARVLGIRVDREPVHHRAPAPAQPVRLAQVEDEARRGVGRPGRAGIVAAARRERAADHDRPRRRRLDRVVGLREQAQVGGGGRVEPLLRELRHPETVQVRLVADDHVADRGNEPWDRGGVGRELLPRGRVPGRGRRPVRIDRDDQADPVGRGRVGDPLERGQLVAGDGGLTGVPDRGDADRVESRLAGERHLGSGLAVPRRVLGCADEQRPRPGRRDGCRDDGRRRGERGAEHGNEHGKKTHRKIGRGRLEDRPGTLAAGSGEGNRSNGLSMGRSRPRAAGRG